MNETEKYVAEVEAALAAGSGRRAQLSLTADGMAAVRAVGVEWLTAAARPLLLAYPDRPIELVLRTSNAQPFLEPWAATPVEIGGAFTGQGGVGRLSLLTDADAAPVFRVVQMPAAALSDAEGEFSFIAPTDRVRRVVGKVYSTLYRKTPLLLDVWRQNRNDRSPGARSPMVPKAQPLVGGEQPGRNGRGSAAWVAMHWLESGGAEAWAFRSAEVAAEAGLDVVITVDRGAPQRQLARALAITPHVYLAANSLTSQDWDPFLRAVLARHDVGYVHIHHSAKAYQFLPELRHLTRRVRVMDSTHLVEHRTGGFVRHSLEFSPLIDVHHVISPALRDLYTLDAGVPAAKVAYRPLTDIDGVPWDVQPAAAARASTDRPLRIGFLGRLAPQKRPFLFVELARRLHRAKPGAFSFLLQGSGVLEDYTEELIARAGLGGVIERRRWGPAADFFDDVDVLVISSDNEGLTLTALEAHRHGALVLSADVGSQATVTSPLMLVPRAPSAFLTSAVRILQRLAEDPAARALATRTQRARLQALLQVQGAADYLATYYTQEQRS